MTNLFLNQPMRFTHLKWSPLSRRAGILFGLFSGLIVSLFISPFNQCTSSSPSSSGYQYKSTNWFEEIINSDYNPIVKLPLTNGSDQLSEQQRKPFNSKRPRFVLDELDVNDQLLIVVLTSDQTYHNLGSLVNETLTPHADRLLFFKESVYSRDASPSPSPSLSQFQQTSESTLTLNRPSSSLIDLYPSQTSEPLLSRILTYLDTSYDSGKVKSYLRGHNFVFLVNDNSYVKGDSLRQLVDNLSVRDHIFAPGGNIYIDSVESTCASIKSATLPPSSSTSPFNQFKSGLLVSSSLVVSCKAKLECLAVACNDSLVKAYQLLPDHSDKLILDHVLFRSSLITYPLFTSKVYVNVHHFHLQSSLNNDFRLLSDLENKIKSFVDKHKHRTGHIWSSTWPLGIPRQHRPIDRFDVIRWNLHENGTIYMPDDLDVFRLENDDERQDRVTMESLAVQWLSTRYPNIESKVSRVKIVNFYQRFDANRGIDYILDMLIPNSKTPDNGVDFKESSLIPIRVEAIKPLVPMTLIDHIPFATEQNRISLVVAVRSDEEVTDTITLMNGYVNLCNQMSDQFQSHNMAMIIALITHNSFPPSGYGRVMSMGLSLQTKYPTLGCKLLFSTIPREPDESYSTSTDLGLLLLLRNRFSSLLTESIVVITSSNIIINSDFLARVQLNTIKGHQIYFPIPFQEFNLRPGSSDSSESRRINKDNGYFSWFDYRHVSFYLEDFSSAFSFIVSTSTPKLNLTDYDLLQLFLQYNCGPSISSSRLHIMRSIEPELRLRYRNEKCDNQDGDKFSFDWCKQTSVYSVGNKAQMANLILNYKKIKFNS